MTASFRLQKKKAHPDCRVDFNETVRFRFDDKQYKGYKGDSLASALLANGVRLFGRSFKYHRPRGVIASGVEEPNALIQLERGAISEPNLPATTIRLYEGLEGKSQNRWPSLTYDVGAINGLLGRFFPAGFYYKTFMWPAKFWEPVYERFIRKAAGLGVAPEGKDPSSYAQKYHHCDILIVGGGINGLWAARSAAKSGARILLMDEQNEWGGHVLDDPEIGEVAGKAAPEFVAEIVAELKQMANVTMVSRTTVAAHYDYNYVTALEHVQSDLGPYLEDKTKPRQRFWKIRAKQIITATGAFERPIIFANNDRPGVMLANAVKSYINRYAVAPGRNIVIFTNNDSAYRVADYAHRAGLNVRIIDSRLLIDEALIKRMNEKNIEVRPHSVVVDTKGHQGLSMVKVATWQDGKLNSPGEWITADCLAMSSGLSPVVHLYSQARGKLSWDDENLFFKPSGAPWPIHAVGAANGDMELEAGLKHTNETLKSVLSALGLEIKGLPRVTRVKGGDILNIEALWEVPFKRGAKAFHEFQNDSTVADVHLAAREGFLSVEHLKRYTTTGMATDQGKTSNINALAVMAKIREMPIPEVGTTKFRPPYSPITFGAITGQNRLDLFQQARNTPLHDGLVEAGAEFEDVGDWKRAHYFPHKSEDMHQAVMRECKQTRDSVGMLDASTLGKIDIQGPDAAWFLNMIYTNKWDQLKIGRCRYGLMCNEHGMVFDDGVTTRLGENHFHMTTTTGGAARVLSWLEEWLQTEWPERKVYCTSVTEQWAVAALNGPNARALLQSICDLDLSADEFPFMSYKEGKVANIPARIYRISFTGECAFEVNVPARYGMALFKAITEAGKAHDLVLYGTESMHVLRAEKGFIIVGQDSDGTVTPSDLGMDWIVSKKKDDFIGRRSHFRSDTARSNRKQLVGILTEDPNEVLPEGAHLVESLKDKPPMKMIGHVTSSYMSPNVGRSIALGLIKNGHSLKGESFYAPMMDGRSIKVTITDPIFFDKEGLRQNG